MASPVALSARGKSSAGLDVALLATAALAACAPSTNSDTTAPGPGQIFVTQGASQVAEVGLAVGPVVVRVTDAAGGPIPGVRVNFTADRGASVSAPSVLTDSSGNASTMVALGRVAGIFTIVATAPTLRRSAVFLEIGVAGDAAIMTIVDGDHQSAPRFNPLPKPLAVEVTDQFGNPVSGVAVVWRSVDGNIAGSSERTDATGKATSQVSAAGLGGAFTVTATMDVHRGQITATFNETAN